MSKDYSKKLPPGQAGLPLVGETLDFMKSPVAFADKRRTKYGKVYRTHLLGSNTVYLIGPKANQWVFAGEGKYLKNRWIYTIRRLLGADSLAMINGDAHRKRRTLLQPSFKYEMMQSFVPEIRELVNQHLITWEAQDHIIFTDRMRDLAFEIIASFLFGEQYKQLDLKALSRLFEQWKSGVFSIPVNVPFTTFGKALRARQTLFNNLQDIINTRRANPTDKHDILNTLMHGKDENGQILSDSTIIDELHLMLFAGHDTTVSANTSVFMLLAQHPDALAQARAEQVAFSDEDLSNIEKLKQMPYLDAVIMEAMRMYPPIANMFRETTQDTEFEGYHIPKGWAIATSQSAAHSDPEVWPQAQTFDPSRYVRGEHKQKAFSHIAFGGGPRLCLGQNFAMIEMRIILATALRHYTWHLLPDQDLSVNDIPLPLPRGGLKLKFTRQG